MTPRYQTDVGQVVRVTGAGMPMLEWTNVGDSNGEKAYGTAEDGEACTFGDLLVDAEWVLLDQALQVGRLQDLLDSLVADFRFRVEVEPQCASKHGGVLGDDCDL